MVEIGPDYVWSLFVACVIGFQCLLQGFAVGRLRSKFFDAKKFDKHKSEYGGKSIPKGGYPDMGCGRFSSKLTYEQWFQFNNYQRVHGNYVEGVATAIVLQLVGSIFYTRVCVVAGLTYILGRVLYAVLYRSVGPSGRLPGAILLDASLVCMAGCAFYGSFQAGGGVNGFLNLVSAGAVQL
mmetsp:Transcript_6676/g.16848  ORF Transcript_6676/g.16848 Transcript_6676/m.16848 type:complete len:181 (-) Transcript_6676:132-674(-)|eukprot:CAMPEP_0177639962 /NCGR_PEP_ID=MMETSP0447-20121125/6294_1 /TAXON_ID=0 /ORGANISM="Stygamoeba regulata, Strain BSH-02190019" /LENGTH=180 /DNA_ID=CAMNT_0019142011 /DNA_START=75 /DNA_END=617 /DNA_ORIENTATION=-